MERPTHVFEARNPVSDDVVRVDLRLLPDHRDPRGDTTLIDEAWFDGDGCVASQAAASMLVEQVEGMSVEQARRFSAAEMLALFGPDLPPSRQKCCLLGWRAFQQALDTPLADFEDVEDDPLERSRFSGPSLSEEG